MPIIVSVEPFSVWFQALREVSPYLFALMAVMLADAFAGVLNALYHRRLNSSIGRMGLLRKTMILLLIVVSVVWVPIDEAFKVVYRLMVLGFIVHETVSILEHAVSIGVPLPSVVVRFVQRKQEALENDDDNR